MTVRLGGNPRTSLSRRSRRLVGIALTLPAFLLAALLVVPGAATAGEGFGPDLTVTMTDDPDPVSAGQRVTFTILVSNTGHSDSTNTHLDFSTGGDSVINARVTGVENACNEVGATASCDLGYLPTSFSSGTAIAPLLASNEAEVIVTVKAPEAPGTEFLSTASATSTGQTDEFEVDNTDTELTNVSEFESASGTVPPGGSITTLNGPLNADDPFAVALKNIGTQALDVTIEEEPCDGTQEGDPLCSVPRVGGVAGDFMFQPSGGGGALGASTPTAAVVVARLYYDVSVLVGVKGFRIFSQKPGGPVVRLLRCDDGVTTECFGKDIKANGDQIVRVRLSFDPRITRG